MNHDFPVGTPVVAFGERGSVSKTSAKHMKAQQVMVTFESGETALCYFHSLIKVADLEAAKTEAAIAVEPPLPTTAMLQRNADLLGITVEELRGEPKPIPAGKKPAMNLQVGSQVVAKRPLSDYRWPVPSWLKAGEPLRIAQTNEMQGEQIYRVVAVDDPSRGPAEGGGWWLTARDLNVPATGKVTK